MSKEKKPKGKDPDGTQELYAIKKDLDATLIKYPDMNPQVLHLIVQARDFTWELIRSEVENRMPFFEKKGEETALSTEDVSYLDK